MKLHVCRTLLIGAFLAAGYSNSYAVKSADGTWEAHGFLENATFDRGHAIGLSKSRTRGQLEWSKTIGTAGIFRDVSFAGTLRADYDAVYDLNSGQFGDSAGGPVQFQSTAGPFPAGTPGVGSSVFWGQGVGLFNSAGVGGPTNPNTGLTLLGSSLGSPQGGVVLAYPTRPCDEDPRGCIAGYMDADKQDLAAPAFTDRADVIREAYVDATLPLSNGDELSFRIGRQQVVWGRTDLFRVLDVINPVDFSQQNIYEELEDARIPMGIFNMEYHAGATDTFEDLNFQFLWKFEQFRPHTLGQGGQPYSILQAGNFFRAMNNCWDNGCTVGNFAPGALLGPPFIPTGLAAVNFGPHQIGIRQAKIPGWKLSNSDVGFRVEGVYKSVGFSANALYYNSYLPSLRGGIPSVSPFVGVGPSTDTATPQVYPYALAFDIAFPRILLLGGSSDFYIDSIKSAFRVEFAWTNGEEFANTARPRLFSESDVIRYVVGWDRPTFIPFLNKNRSFLISAQVFGQHLLNYEKHDGPFGPVGIPDWQENWVGTLLFQGFYKNDTVQPRIIMAYDVRARAGAVAPQVDWLISDNWRMVVGANIKVGKGRQAFDDNRSAVPYNGITALGGPPVGGSAGLGGFEPLGRFRSGPIGMAQQEDEIQISLRYRF